MKKLRLLSAACACISVFTAPQAMSTTIDTYFGWNYVGASVSIGGSPVPLPELYLNSITYQGGSGTVTQDMDFGVVGGAMPDGEGLATKPTSTYDTGTLTGDGQSTRTDLTSLPIDWIDAGTLTPWGQTYSFPTIGITGIMANGVSGFVLSSAEYIVGLIPFGADTELDSAGFGSLQSDIYDSTRQTIFFADPNTGIDGQGSFIFSAAAASPVPVPAAIWLFGSGLLGLVGIARRKKA